MVVVIVGVRWQRRKQQRAQRPAPRLPGRSSYEESDADGNQATAAHTAGPHTTVWHAEVSSRTATARRSTDTSVSTAAPGSPPDHIGVPRKSTGGIDSFINLDGGNTQRSSTATDGNMLALEPDKVTPEGAIDPNGQYLNVELRKREARDTDRKGKYIGIDLSKTEVQEQSRVSYISVGAIASARPSLATIANPTYPQFDRSEGRTDSPGAALDTV